MEIISEFMTGHRAVVQLKRKSARGEPVHLSMQITYRQAKLATSTASQNSAHSYKSKHARSRNSINEPTDLSAWICGGVEIQVSLTDTHCSQKVGFGRCRGATMRRQICRAATRCRQQVNRVGVSTNLGANGFVIGSLSDLY